MTNQLRVVNASAAEPLYVFVTPNPAWQIADGVVGLVSTLIPVGEISALVKEAIIAVRAANAGASTGFIADLTIVLDDAITYLQGTWVGEATQAVYQAVEKGATTVYEIYTKLSQLLTMKKALIGMRDTVGGMAALDQAQKRLDDIIEDFDTFIGNHAYKVQPLEIQGYDEISKNPLDYLSPSGWAALANADTAHLTIYRKGRYLADFNAHSQSAYVCTDDLVWRIDGDDWGDRVEMIHGVTPVAISATARQDVECFYKNDLKLVGDTTEGYKPQEILKIAVKPEYRVLPLNLRVDLQWKDQGQGNQKGYLVMTLLRDGRPVQGPNGNVVASSGMAPHELSTTSIQCPDSSEFVNAMKPGDEIVLSAVVGAGGGHELFLKSLLVTIPTSTLIYEGPPFEKRITVAEPPVRNLYHTFPLVTHPFAGLPVRGNWVPKVRKANVVVNWDADTLLNEIELKKVLAGEPLEEHNLIDQAIRDGQGNNSIRTVVEVWKNGVKSAEEALWTNAPDPEGLKGPDLWLMDVPDSILAASQLPKDTPPVPVEWAISIWYEADNNWPVFRRDTHLKIDTWAMFVEYHW